MPLLSWKWPNYDAPMVRRKCPFFDASPTFQNVSSPLIYTTIGNRKRKGANSLFKKLHVNWLEFGQVVDRNIKKFLFEVTVENEKEFLNSDFYLIE